MPTHESLLRLVREMALEVECGGRCLVHCHAGYGRTGLLIACYLVYARNYSAGEAIALVRLRRHKAIQTRAQVGVVTMRPPADVVLCCVGVVLVLEYFWCAVVVVLVVWCDVVCYDSVRVAFERLRWYVRMRESITTTIHGCCVQTHVLLPLVGGAPYG